MYNVYSAGIGLFGVGTAAALGRGVLQLSLALGIIIILTF